MEVTNLQALLDATPPGETVALRRGEYQGPLHIPAAVILEGGGSTIWCLQGPVVTVTCDGVSLRDLNIQVTSPDETEPATALALQVSPGVQIDLADIFVRGDTAGVEGEDGQWLLPAGLNFGHIAPRESSAYELDVHAAAPCQLRAEVAGLTLKPSALKPGLNRVTVTFQGISENIIISGSIHVRSAFITRSIGISANTLTGAAPLHQPGDLVWKPAHAPMQAPDLAVRIDPPGGVYTEEQKIQLSCAAPHAVIRYSAGTSAPPDPTEQDDEYTGGLLGVGRSAIIKARAFDPTWGAGPLAEEHYTLAVPPVAVLPDPGVFDGPVAVELSCPDPQVTIAYTLDETEPTEKSDTYSHLLRIDHTVTLRAKAYRSGWQPSQTLTARYELKDAEVTAPEPAKQQEVPPEEPDSEPVLSIVAEGPSEQSKVILEEIPRTGSVPVTEPSAPSNAHEAPEPTPIPAAVEDRRQKYRSGGHPSSAFGSGPAEATTAPQADNQAPKPDDGASGLGNAFTLAGASPAPAVPAQAQEKAEPAQSPHLQPPPKAKDADPPNTAEPTANSSGTSIPTWAQDKTARSGNPAAPSLDNDGPTLAPRIRTDRPQKGHSANSVPTWLGPTQGPSTSGVEASAVKSPVAPAPEATAQAEEGMDTTNEEPAPVRPRPRRTPKPSPLLAEPQQAPAKPESSPPGEQKDEAQKSQRKNGLGGAFQ